MTLIIIMIFLIPLIIKIYKKPKYKVFPLYVVMSGMIFFFFGFQVHEKAIMMPLTIL